MAGPYWINDQIIAFYFQYLESNTFKEFSHRLLFVSPQVTQLVKLSDPDECLSLLEPLRPSRKRLILFPVNDNATSAAGGLHWSLLVYSRNEDIFYNFDSLNGFNLKPTKKLVHSLRKGLRRPFAELLYHDSAQQTNLVDCGIHVLMNAENICNHFLQEDVVMNTPIISVTDKRQEILNLIARLGGKIQGE